MAARTLAVVMVLVVTGSSVGCRDGDDADGDGGDAVPTTTAPVDPCLLLGQDRVSEIVGTDVEPGTPLTDGGADQGCRWTVRGDGPPSRVDLTARRSSETTARDRYERSKAQSAGSDGYAEVDGVGDDAFRVGPTAHAIEAGLSLSLTIIGVDDPDGAIAAGLLDEAFANANG